MDAINKADDVLNAQLKLRNTAQGFIVTVDLPRGRAKLDAITLPEINIAFPVPHAKLPLIR